MFERNTGIVIQIPQSDNCQLKNIYDNASDEAGFTSLVNKKMESPETRNPEFFRMIAKLHTHFGAFVIQDPKEGIPQEISDYIYRNGLYALVLETTTACNMRCKYCAYSGFYKGYRLHSMEHMPLEVALKATDIYFEYIERGKDYNPERVPGISFHGGEPLLNFNLIRDVVNYVKFRYSKDYEVDFQVTTNGTLLTDEIIDFLLLNGFSIDISLNGPQGEHDRTRIYSDGSGTFDTVMRSIKRINQRIEKLGINERDVRRLASVTYDLKSDLVGIWRFFTAESPIQPSNIAIVTPFGTEYYLQFSREEKEKFTSILDTLLCHFISYISNEEYLKKSDAFFDRFFNYTLQRHHYKQLFIKHPIYEYTTSCVPGYRIYVDVKGIFYPCERSSIEVRIGSVNEGLNFELINKIIKKYRKNVLEKCHGCPLAYHCGCCIAILSLEDDNRICDFLRKAFLDNEKKRIKAYKKKPEYFASEYFAPEVVNLGEVDLNLR